MTREECLEKMDGCERLGIEEGHFEADVLLCELVKEFCPFGGEVVDRYEKLHKWYA